MLDFLVVILQEKVYAGDATINLLAHAQDVKFFMKRCILTMQFIYTEYLFYYCYIFNITINYEMSKYEEYNKS